MDLSQQCGFPLAAQLKFKSKVTSFFYLYLLQQNGRLQNDFCDLLTGHRLGSLQHRHLRGSSHLGWWPYLWPVGGRSKEKEATNSANHCAAVPSRYIKSSVYTHTQKKNQSKPGIVKLINDVEYHSFSPSHKPATLLSPKWKKKKNPSVCHCSHPHWTLKLNTY